MILGQKWGVLCDFENGCYLMRRHLTQVVEFGILLRRDFLLLQPHLQEEAEKLNLEHPDPKKIDTTAGKLRGKLVVFLDFGYSKADPAENGSI